VSAPRDVQREKCYRAERVAFAAAREAGLAGRPELPALADSQAFVDKVVASAWTRRTFPGCRTRVVVTDGRARRRGSASGGSIAMPVWTRSRYYLLHELAHVLYPRTLERGAGVRFWSKMPGAWHGWEFCSRYLLLVRHFLGAEAHAALRDAFKANRVRYTAPRASRAPSPAALAALARVNAARKAAGPAKPRRVAGEPPAPGMVKIGRFWMYPAPWPPAAPAPRPAYPPCESDI
jgi:putative metallohydrolase (TIGR04338 family)